MRCCFWFSISSSLQYFGVGSCKNRKKKLRSKAKSSLHAADMVWGGGLGWLQQLLIKSLILHQCSQQLCACVCVLGIIKYIWEKTTYYKYVVAYFTIPSLTVWVNADCTGPLVMNKIFTSFTILNCMFSIVLLYLLNTNMHIWFDVITLFIVPNKSWKNEGFFLLFNSCATYFVYVIK